MFSRDAYVITEVLSCLPRYNERTRAVLSQNARTPSIHASRPFVMISPNAFDTKRYRECANTANGIDA